MIEIYFHKHYTDVGYQFVISYLSKDLLSYVNFYSLKSVYFGVQLWWLQNYQLTSSLVFSQIY
jgi:hypothetical protein